MKILFVPYYYYLQYETFRLVIRALAQQGVESSLLFLRNSSYQDEGDRYNECRFKQDSIPFTELVLKRDAVRRRFVVPLRQLSQFYGNRQRLRRELALLQPDSVVIGSHLGGTYIRVIQELCSRSRIPVTSVWKTYDRIKPDQVPSMPVFAPPLLKDIAQWGNYNSYTANHQFLVTEQALREHLLGIGVREDQIVITGDPERDLFFCAVRASRTKAFTDTYIVLLTEVIHELYGLDYLNNLLAMLCKALAALPAEVRTVVKFHPRETDTTRQLYKNHLAGPRATFLDDCEMSTLLADATLVLGHNSKALETAIMVGTPIFVVEIIRTPENPLPLTRMLPELCCRTPHELEDRLARYFADPEYKNVVMQLVADYLSRHHRSNNGQASERMAHAIMTFTANWREKRGATT